MAKIEHIEPGKVIPNDEEPPAEPPKQIEVTVTPQPKTRGHRRGNAIAEHLLKEQERQGQTTPLPHKLSSWQKKARRKRERGIRRHAIEADLSRGVITPEQAKERLPKRQKPGTPSQEI